jgi:hypothetical protein
VKAITKQAKPAEDITEQTSPDTLPPGFRPARPGLQPVRDLVAFLQSLPDFGKDADRILKLIVENRAERRRQSEGHDC